MRLIVCINNVGHNSACDFAAFNAIEHGIATSVCVRLDAPETIGALRRMRDYPWISVGWQDVFLGKPVRPQEKVATLISGNGDFRQDLKTAQDVSRVEVLLELRAELFRCSHYLGYIPTYRDTEFLRTSPFGRAVSEIDQEFGIITRYCHEFNQESSDNVDAQWEARKIIHVPASVASAATAEEFVTAAEILQTKDDVTWLYQCTPESVDLLCNSKISDWVLDNGVELVNMHDALFGTREYQNHLRSDGSDLAVL